MSIEGYYNIDDTQYSDMIAQFDKALSRYVKMIGKASVEKRENAFDMATQAAYGLLMEFKELYEREGFPVMNERESGEKGVDLLFRTAVAAVTAAMALRTFWLPGTKLFTNVHEN